MRRPLYGSNQRRRSIREFWQIQQEIEERRKEIEHSIQEPTPKGLTAHDITSLTDDSRYSRNVLFTFSTAALGKTDRVRFFYALKGRGRKRGIIDELDGMHLGPGAVLVPGRYCGVMERFLSQFTSEHSRMDVWVQKPSRKMRIRRGFEVEKY